MRVVWIVPGFSSDESDWCIPALLNLARGLAQRCDLHVVALRYPYRRDTYRIGSATVHAIGGGHHGPQYTPAIWWRAAQLVRNLDGEILHAFWAWEPGVIAAWSKSPSPCVISLAGGELVHYRAINYGLMGRAYVRCLLRWALRRSRLVTAGSRTLLKIASGFVDNGRLRLAPLGVDMAAWNSPTAMVAEPLLLNVGSLEPVKGQQILLDAFRLVLNVMPHSRLRIVGDGRMRETLQDYARRLAIEEKLEFSGAVRHDRLPAIYQASALLIQSSLYESQGMAVLEAAASGLPVLGSEVGTLADLAPEAAVATPPGNAEQLAEAVISLQCDQDRKDTLSRNARARVEREYSLDAAVDRFLRIYQQALGGD